MTDSAPFLLPSLESNPNHPAFSQARERRADEVYTDAYLYMQDLETAACLLFVARTLADALDAHEPASDEFRATWRATRRKSEECLGLAETLHDELESAVTGHCPAAFRDWAARNRRTGR